MRLEWVTIETLRKFCKIENILVLGDERYRGTFLGCIRSHHSDLTDSEILDRMKMLDQKSRQNEE